MSEWVITRFELFFTYRIFTFDRMAFKDLYCRIINARTAKEQAEHRRRAMELESIKAQVEACRNTTKDDLHELLEHPRLSMILDKQIKEELYPSVSLEQHLKYVSALSDTIHCKGAKAQIEMMGKYDWNDILKGVVRHDNET